MKGPQGRPPKPNELHCKLGNPSHKSLPNLDDVNHLPQLDISDIELPSYVVFGEGGQEVFDFIIKHVTWLAPSDLLVVIRAAQLEDDINTVRIRSHKYKNHKDADVMAKLIKQQGLIFSALAMSPADRTRQNVGEVRAMKDSLKIAQALNGSWGGESREKRIIINALVPPQQSAPEDEGADEIEP